MASELVHLFLVASDIGLAAERLEHWTCGCVFSDGFGKRVTNVLVNKWGRVCRTAQHPAAGGIHGGMYWWPVLRLGTE